MSLRDHTKYAFSDAIKKVLLTKNLQQVRVKELCEIVGAERPTFYYHFQDKYELIAWIYEQDVKQAIEYADGRYNIIQLEYLLTTMRKEQIFYQKAFTDVSQNNLYAYIHETNLRLFAKIIKEQFHLQTLTAEQVFTLGFYTHAWIGCLHDWITKKYEVSAQEYASWMYTNVQHLNISDIHVMDLK